MKKSIKKIMTLIIVTTTILGNITIPTNAEWKRDSVGWWNTEGTSYSVGWRQIDSKWYYFNTNGYMETGWISDTDGKYYYLNADGSMASNTVTPDGYTVDASGVWVSTISKVDVITNTQPTTSIQPVQVKSNVVDETLTSSSNSSDNSSATSGNGSGSSSSSPVATLKDEIIIDDVGTINPSKNSFIGVDKETKMTIYYYKSNGKVAQIQNPGICDGTNIYDSNNEVYNYIVVDSDRNIAFNPEHLYVENGKLVKKSSSGSITSPTTTPIVTEPTDPTPVIEPVEPVVTSPPAVAMV